MHEIRAGLFLNVALFRKFPARRNLDRYTCRYRVIRFSIERIRIDTAAHETAASATVYIVARVRYQFISFVIESRIILARVAKH